MRAEALLLEVGVADREDLVDQEDLWFEVGRHRERQTQVHPGRVALHRRVEELRHARELHDLVELRLDLASAHPKDGTGEVDVVAPGELGVEAGADLEQRADLAADLGPSLGGRGDPRRAA